MKSAKSYIFKLFIAIFLIALAYCVAYFNQKNPLELVQHAEQVLHEKESEVSNTLKEYHQFLLTNEPKALFTRNQSSQATLYKDKGIVYLVYQHDSLLYWSDNSAAVEEYMKEVCLDNKTAKLKNGFYEITSLPQLPTDRYRLFGLILVKHDFSYQNNFLTNEFFKDYPFSKEVLLSETPFEESLTLKNTSGNVLFYLNFPKEYTSSNNLLDWISVILFYIGIFLLIYNFRNLIFYKARSKSVLFQFFFFGTVLLLIRMTIWWMGNPISIQNISVFKIQPNINSPGLIFENLSDVLFTALILVWISYFVKNKFISSQVPYRLNGIGLNVLVTFLVGYGMLIFYFTGIFIQQSAFSLMLNQFYDVSVHSLFALLALAMILVSVYFFSRLIVYLHLINLNTLKHLLFFLLFILILLIFLFLTAGKLFFVVGTSIIILYFFVLLLKWKSPRFTFLNGILTAFVFSVFTSFMVYYFNHLKEVAVRKTIAEQVAGSRDAVVENLFSDVRKNVLRDERLMQMMKEKPIPSLQIEQRLRQVYLAGFWEHYQVNLSLFDSLCRPLIAVADPILENNSYFDELIQTNGIKTLAPDFYFINQPGKDSRYIGKIELKSITSVNEKPNLLYLECIPTIESPAAGFPELLLDKTTDVRNPSDDYDYAVYRNGKLFLQSGIYQYPQSYSLKKDTGNAITFFENGYHHLMLVKQPDTIAIVSKPQRIIPGIFTTNSYFFIFSSLLMWILFVFKELKLDSNKHKQRSIHLRIQLVIVSIVLFCMVGWGIGTSMYVKSQFLEKNTFELNEKMDIVQQEIKTVLKEQGTLKVNYRDYNGYVLKKLSASCLSDITLYDAKGNLYTSSQPRLFDEGIISKKMNPEAYRQLLTNDAAHVVVKDNIGNLNFMSAYRPILSENGKLIAYVNLPYFAKQKNLEKELNSYLVALVNMYVVLFSLSTFVALFISNIVTRPLRILKQNLSTITIGKHNEPIFWGQNDEIGSLVNEYNKMILKLEENIIKLAQSEREGAWKEMAKQVAHEIKNPLTPMKLSVQHLLRSIDAEPEFLNERIKRLSAMLIEQIDRLALIAGEFSSFAKMPAPNMQYLSCSELIKNTIALYQENDNLNIRFHDFTEGECKIYIDKDQFCRVIINLVKNAQQAIAENPEGRIDVLLKSYQGDLVIHVSDNGNGIPDQFKDQIFSPNFSTKTEGMGLGLAISKSIIQGFNGEIKFISELGKGTTFIITLPLANS